MRAAKNIVPSGLHPEPAPSLEGRVLQHTEDICNAFIAAVKESLAKIKEAEQAAIARLEQYVPTERLLTRTEAAAYLKIQPRTLDYLTSPSVLEIPFNWIGGVKRFRKAQLDAHLAREEVKRRKQKL